MSPRRERFNLDARHPRPKVVSDLLALRIETYKWTLGRYRFVHLKPLFLWSAMTCLRPSLRTSPRFWSHLGPKSKFCCLVRRDFTFHYYCCGTVIYYPRVNRSTKCGRHGKVDRVSNCPSIRLKYENHLRYDVFLCNCVWYTMGVFGRH